ncbi:RNA-binding domain-containing protein [Trichoderma novae-zelandiae]
METTRIFVKGLPPSITEADFRKHFSANNREITDVKLIPQRRIGYVGYKTPQDASGAVKYFNKSYIRMSKISVEPARPISDSAPSKSQRSVHSDQHVASHQRPNQDEEGTSKKRKREDLDESDPKLREFLRVMKTGKKGVLADETNPDADMAGLATGGDALVEGESDDEYEQIPKSKEKLRKTESSEASRSLVTGQRPPRETSDQTTLPPAKEVVAGDVKPQETEKLPQHDAGATDDDWLRSRTNRLLDLVDPDDLPRPAESAVEAETVVQDDGDNGDTPPSPRDAVEEETPAEADDRGAEGVGADDAIATIMRTSRLFVRNLPYTTTEEDLHREFGKFGTLQEVHLPTNASGAGKGFALVLFDDSSDAVNAFQALDGVTFQGRILHIIPAEAKKQTLDEFGMSKLPLKKQNMIRKKAEASTSVFNWNSMFMSQDAVNASVAARLGVSKSEVLDPTSADAAVKQAIAETTVIQETKAYFASNGVDLDAFKSHKRGGTSILVKNFPYGTSMEELRKMFEECGPVLRVLMPPAGTIAIVQFAQLNHAKAAFGKMAYRRVKDSVLFLEKAPVDLFTQDAAQAPARPVGDQRTGVQKLSVDELLSSGDKEADEPAETASLFVRNLNFATTTNRLAEVFEPLDGFVSARVKTKIDAKRPGQTLSMGFGFVEFRSKSQAQAALKAMDGYVLDGHALGVKPSHRGHDAAEERRREDAAKKAAAQRTKIVIKNLPFQATKKDIRTLFGTYGQLRSVRVPKKADYTARGFAFADFVTPREAENALNALKDTHLLGRRLVLDFAAAEAVDAEEEIEKMQRKVGGQANKMALQQLTGGGRKRVTIGNDEDELEA